MTGLPCLWHENFSMKQKKVARIKVRADKGSNFRRFEPLSTRTFILIPSFRVILRFGTLFHAIGHDIVAVSLGVNPEYVTIVHLVLHLLLVRHAIKNTLTSARRFHQKLPSDKALAGWAANCFTISGFPCLTKL